MARSAMLEGAEAEAIPNLNPKLTSYLTIFRHIAYRLNYTLLHLTLIKQTPKQDFSNTAIPAIQLQTFPHGGAPLRNVIVVFARRISELNLTLHRIVMREGVRDREAGKGKEKDWSFSLAVVESVEDLGSVRGEEEGVFVRGDGEGEDDGGENDGGEDDGGEDEDLSKVFDTFCN